MANVLVDKRNALKYLGYFIAFLLRFYIAWIKRSWEFCDYRMGIKKDRVLRSGVNNK